LTITEPVTLLTDYLLGTLALWLAFQLLQTGGAARSLARTLWAAAFFGLATASFAGGTYHGFTEPLGGAGRTLTWKLTLVSIGVVSLTLTCGATLAAFEGFVRRAVVAFAVGKFVVYLVWISAHDEFVYAIADYVPAMLYVLVLQARAWRQQGPSGPWIVAGVLVSFFAAAIQQSGFTLHEHFNHNDLYHLIQMLGVYLLYRGGTLL
jgi:hypothetical protein